ncbi:MAG TPA: DUF4159 domain-containing protein [Alphaproteobacteria bacterium]|nr:DUF4159 domain-containing protein [Alphaproteobacteria bacterium]
MPLFEPLSFLSPWLLAALVLLPALWWLLKVTPPAARRLPFPALRLLMGLKAEEETPARTPLWLAILRLILAGLVVIALAHPLIGSGPRFTGSGPVLLVIDDGWAAAPDWAKRQAVIGEILSGAEREQRPVAVLTTAPPESGDAIASPQPARASEARKLVQALQPKPWPADRAAARAALDAALASKDGAALRKPAAIIWICDGLEDQKGAATSLAADLAGLGSVRVLFGDRGVPHLMLPPDTEGGRFTVKALRPESRGAPQQEVRLRAADDAGHVLAVQPLIFPDGTAHAETVLDLPSEVANGIARLDIEEESSAGAAFLLDERWRRRIVGLVTSTPQESDRPLLGDLYYLKRALTPFSDVRIGPLPDLLKAEASVLALPDQVGLSPDERKQLDAWIAKGGVLLRFAGPHMAESADLAAGTPRDELIPVALRRGGRALGGVMSWTAPMSLAPFDAASPFAGLGIPGDVAVERQVLAEPSLDLGAKTWAQLADGTPLVTSDHRGSGWLVLFHITANANWSNLPLSGLFVEMLHRVVELSRGAVGKPGGAPLPPYRSLDGFGRLKAPPVAAIAFDPSRPAPIGPKHPPGFYGNEGARLAVNLASAVTAPIPIETLPPGVVRGSLAPAPAVDLKPWLWLAAFLLALVDLGVSLGLRGLLPRGFGRAASGAAMVAGLAFAVSLAWSSPAAAQSLSGDDEIITATAQTHLAYVRTGDHASDEESEAGLRGLTRIVNRRTAAELSDPMGIDIERDEILFFPLLYWPVSVDQPVPSPEAAERLNKYLATGGIILFDTGDAKLGLGSDRRGGFSWDAPGAAILRQIVQNLRIPPLVPVPADHVLTRSYYLMQEFPGRFAGGTLWVAAEEGQANDGVSPVIVGSNDFAGAWALDQDARTVYPVVPGGAAQREQAFRFGINLVMYALTGNYKADQVHVPAILERLGQ